MGKFLLSTLLLLTTAFASTAAENEIAIVAKGANYDGTATKIECDNSPAIASNICSISVSSYNASSKEFRSNANATFTITPAQDVTITKVVFTNTNSSNVGTVTLESQPGTLTDSSLTFTWTGESTNDIKIKSTKQLRIKYFEITYKTKEVVGKTKINLELIQSVYSINLGENFTNPIGIDPDTEEVRKSILYSSSNLNVATISENGEISIKGVGETKITASIPDDNEKYYASPIEFTLYVKDPNSVVDILKHNTNTLDANDYTTATEYTSVISNVKYQAITYNSSGYQFNTKDKVGIIVLNNPDNYILSNIKIYPSSSMTDKQAGNGVKIYANNLAYTTTGSMDGDLIASPSGKDPITILPSKDYEYFSIVPNAGVYQISYIEIEWKPKEKSEPLALPEIICDQDLTNDIISATNNVTINFKKVEGIDIYYKVNSKDNVNTPTTRAVCEDPSHSSYTLHQGEDIELNNTHSSIEYMACEPATGRHSAVKTLALDITTGVEEIEAAETGEVRWFDMQGREVKGQPEKGIYVRVVNGKASKVIL